MKLKKKCDHCVFISIIATIFLASIMSLMDYLRIIPFSDDINIIFPYSLLFYPLIGLVAETVFHVVPLKIIKGIVKGNGEKISIKIILIISLFEPIFQTIFSINKLTIFPLVYVAAHIYLFNYIQLVNFKKNGFWVMYALRVYYYLIWHIIWGHLRLNLIF